MSNKLIFIRSICLAAAYRLQYKHTYIIYNGPITIIDLKPISTSTSLRRSKQKQQSKKKKKIIRARCVYEREWSAARTQRNNNVHKVVSHRKLLFIFIK